MDPVDPRTHETHAALVAESLAHATEWDRIEDFAHPLGMQPLECVFCHHAFRGHPSRAACRVCMRSAQP